VTALVKSLNAAGPIPDNVDVVVGVPMPYLSIVRSTLRSDIEVAGQDSCVKAFGANTGETAAAMLTEVGCTWVILGHSERRAGFNGHAQELRKGESNETVATKTKLAVDAGLKVMVCVGEHKEER
jgi:triosephosphate isomerase